MLDNTFFIVSKGKEKATVMNRFTKEAFTRKIDKKGQIIINCVKYALDDMKTLTDSMMKMKVLESQGCSAVGEEEDFFPTELKHDSSELLFYLDYQGFVNVNGHMYLREDADVSPRSKSAIFSGVFSSDGSAYLSDYPAQVKEQLLNEAFFVGGKQIEFKSMEEVTLWIKDIILCEFGEIPSPVEFKLVTSEFHPARLTFSIANAVGRYKDVTYGVTLNRVRIMNIPAPFSLYTAGKIC